MHWFLPLLGGVLVAIGMSDLARTLFHPSDHGNISDWMTRRIWRVFQRVMPSKLGTAGPTNFLVVITYWGASVVIGFALIYLPFIPQQFVLSPGMDNVRFAAHPFEYASTLSLASLITVTLGMQTNSALLQFAMGLEAVFGFVILTASIAWLLSIYPVIEHRRSLAQEITLLHFAEEKGISNLERMNDTDLTTLLMGTAEQVATVRMELSQFPITYYFQENDEKSAIAPALYYMCELAEDIAARRPGAVMGATVLGGALDELINEITKRYLKRNYRSRWEALEAINADHRRAPLRRPPEVRAA